VQNMDRHPALERAVEKAADCERAVPCRPPRAIP